jgi:uncharacterized protein (TIGR02246 family)
MRGITLIALVAAWSNVPAAFSAEQSRACQPVTKEQIAALFERWNASLQTKNADEVVKNYAPDAVLLPTVSNKPRTNHEQIREYFVHFLEKAPKGAIISRMIHIGCNDAFDVGTYNFTLTEPDAKTAKVPARYSFFYELRDGKWLIVHHHSSAMPEKAAVASEAQASPPSSIGKALP